MGTKRFLFGLMFILFSVNLAATTVKVVKLTHPDNDQIIYLVSDIHGLNHEGLKTLQEHKHEIAICAQAISHQPSTVLVEWLRSYSYYGQPYAQSVEDLLEGNWFKYLTGKNGRFLYHLRMLNSNSSLFHQSISFLDSDVKMRFLVHLIYELKKSIDQNLRNPNYYCSLMHTFRDKKYTDYFSRSRVNLQAMTITWQEVLDAWRELIILAQSKKRLEAKYCKNLKKISGIKESIGKDKGSYRHPSLQLAFGDFTTVSERFEFECAWLEKALLEEGIDTSTPVCESYYDIIMQGDNPQGNCPFYDGANILNRFLDRYTEIEGLVDRMVELKGLAYLLGSIYPVSFVFLGYNHIKRLVTFLKGERYHEDVLSISTVERDGQVFRFDEQNTSDGLRNEDFRACSLQPLLDDVTSL